MRIGGEPRKGGFNRVADLLAEIEIVRGIRIGQSERIIQPCFASELDARALVEVRGKRKPKHDVE